MNATILEYAGFLAWYSERTSDGMEGRGVGRAQPECFWQSETFQPLGLAKSQLC